jgi:transposase
MRPQLSPETCAQIIALRELGCTIYKIANQLHLHPSTVSCTCKRYSKTHSFHSDRAKSGRPRKLKLADARFVALSLARTRVTTAATLQHEYFPDVSTETIRRRLRELGIYSYVRRRVPLLTARHVQKRREWARDHATWSAQKWRWAVFSDESKFNVFGSDGPQRVWRRPGQALDPCYTKKVVKHGGGSVMVWGCITAKGIGQLYRIHGRLTAVRYAEILDQELLGTLNDHSISPGDCIFQHDNDPKHTAKLVKLWLSNHTLNVLPWPSNSPDMNIIENVWDYSDRWVRMRPILPTNVDKLWAALQEEWACIPQSYIDKLFDSMPHRVEELIAAKGKNTRY